LTKYNIGYILIIGNKMRFNFLFISRKEVKNMPNRDGTGPEGKGPKTGRGQGSCGSGTPKRDGSGAGLGRGKRKK
jgi:hypothetical protein